MRAFLIPSVALSAAAQTPLGADGTIRSNGTVIGAPSIHVPGAAVTLWDIVTDSRSEAARDILDNG